jgi:hypothetical protein
MLRFRRHIRFRITEDGRLRVVGRGKRTVRLTFLADGLLVDSADARSEHAVVLPWDAHASHSGWTDLPLDRWGITFFSAGRSSEFGVAVYVNGRFADATLPLYKVTMGVRRRLFHTLAMTLGGNVLLVSAGGWLFDPGTKARATIDALCALLRGRPELRPRLDDPERMAPLAVALTKGAKEPPAPAEGFAGETINIVTALRTAGFEHEFGRPLSTSQVVPLDHVLDRTRAVLAANPYREGRPIDEAKLRRLAKRNYSDVEPWPFEPLVAD